jgi:hypothetical protein
MPCGRPSLPPGASLSGRPCAGKSVHKSSETVQ